MKFYFDGELIRTSKTKRYTHAVVAPVDQKAAQRPALSLSKPNNNTRKHTETHGNARRF